MADIIIFIALAFGVVLGFKKGFFGSLIDFVGGFLILILAFLFKNPISIFMYSNFPFFNIGGIAVLNILLYELIAFLIVYSVLMIIYRVIIGATTIFEKFLTMTVVFGIPSKLLGAIVGLLDGFVFVFIALYILTLPVFNIEILNDSKMAKGILENTPILSSLADKTVDVIGEFKDLKEKYNVEEDNDKLNLEALDLFLKYEIIDVDSVEKLIDKDKLQISNIESVLKKYRNQNQETEE